MQPKSKPKLFYIYRKTVKVAKGETDKNITSVSVRICGLIYNFKCVLKYIKFQCVASNLVFKSKCGTTLLPQTKEIFK